MKGLLYKDFQTLWRTAKINIAISTAILAFYIFGAQKSIIIIMLLMYAAMVISMGISATNTVDSVTGWCMLIGTLPLSRSKIVFEKYLFILISSSGITVLYYILLTVQKLIDNEPYNTGNFADLSAPILLFTFIVINSCINQISAFCFKSVKGAICANLFIILCSLVLSIVSALKSVQPVFVNVDIVVISVSALLISFIVLSLSFCISYLVYRKKDLI